MTILETNLTVAKQMNNVEKNLLKYFCFCFWLVIRIYILLRTEKSVILSTGNKLHVSLSCETTLLMFSCGLIECDKCIHCTTSPAKLVYYS